MLNSVIVYVLTYTLIHIIFFLKDVDLDFAVGLGNVDLLKHVVVLLGRTDLAAYYSALPQASFLSTQLDVQRNLLYELNRQTEEVTRSIPRGLLYLFEVRLLTVLSIGKFTSR